MSMAKRLLMSGNGSNPILAPGHPNLLAMYTMDNISGTDLFDESSNNYDGVIQGSPSIVSGQIGDAMNFDGVDDEVFITSPTKVLNSSVGALSFWAFNATAVESLGLSVYFNSLNTTAFNILMSAGTLPRIDITNVSGTLILRITSTVTAPLSQWNHIVVQTTGSAYEMFINGSGVATSTTTGSNNGDWFDTLTLQFMNLGLIGSDPLTFKTGILDETRVFDRPLTGSEITALANET